MILLIDNYDSFVHNLARYFAEMGCETLVVRDDAVDRSAVRRLSPQAIVLSPGPCSPSETRSNLEVVREFGGVVPLLGVCLGHQSIAAAHGARIVRAPEPVHGRTSPVHHDGDSLFDGIPSPFDATRYHSLVVDESTLPSEFVVTARLEDGTPMAIRHRDHLVVGVQFHPESVLSPHGPRVLANFLDLAGVPRANGLPCDLVADEPPSGEASDDRPVHW